MDAAPILAKIAEAQERHGLVTVLIGQIGSGAARDAGRPTVDFDFCFHKTATNLKKLKRIVGRPGRDGATSLPASCHRKSALAFGS